jgi:hypothetical protein
MAVKVASWPERYKCDGIDLVKNALVHIKAIEQILIEIW